MSYQKTIKNKISFKGVGIHTGEVTNVTCTPAPAGKGISFERVDLDSRPRWTLPAPLFVGDSEGAARRSRLGSQVGQIETVEHLMSAVWGLGISNLHVEVHGPEIPILDGSAEEFVRSFLKTGLVEQEVSRPSFAVNEPLFVHSGKSAILGRGIYQGNRARQDFLHRTGNRYLTEAGIGARCFLSKYAGDGGRRPSSK